LKSKHKGKKKLNDRIAKLEKALLSKSFRKQRLEADTGGSLLRDSKRSMEEDKKEG